MAHIDHGKSTLADRFLELTHTLPTLSTPLITAGAGSTSSSSSSAGDGAEIQQILDRLKVERERGITVKAQSVSMVYRTGQGEEPYLLNLIDTPGHVDFASEVMQSLYAISPGLEEDGPEGQRESTGTAILLVDATQGIQAQTLSVLTLALSRSLRILPVLNKVDLPHADVARVSSEVRTLLDLPPDEPIHCISAKNGTGVKELLQYMVENCPPPKGTREDRFRGLVFDSWFDRYKGVVSMISIKDGQLRKGDRIQSHQTSLLYEITSLGVMSPLAVPLPSSEYLSAGQVGYVTCAMKSAEEASLGDTFFHALSSSGGVGTKAKGDPDKAGIRPLGGFGRRRCMVYAGLYPVESGGFGALEENVRKLALNDRSVEVARESSVALGQGFRLGFLGSLHMEVFKQRLEDEYASDVIVTRPFVPIQITTHSGEESTIDNPADFPDGTGSGGKYGERVKEAREPWVRATIVTPDEFVGPVTELCAASRGEQESFNYLNTGTTTTTNVASTSDTDSSPATSPRVSLVYLIPLSSLVTHFHSLLKSSTSGYASLDYESIGWRPSDLVRLNILLNGKPVDALASVVHRSRAEREGREWVGKLKEVVRKQQFEVVVQAVVAGKVVARERISPHRKDVTANLSGGHYERKMKHLQKQKEGKKRLKRIGNVDVSPEAFFSVLGVGAGGGAGGGKK